MTSVEKVRLRTGDETAPYVFTDTQVQYFLDEHSDNINLAAADMLEAWAAKYAANADTEKIGDYSYSQKIVDKMLSLAKSLREKESNVPIADWASMDLTGEEE